MKIKILPCLFCALVLNLNAQVGDLDLTFDSDGIQSTPVLAYADFCNAIAVQNDGKIVVAGSVSNGADSDIGIVRLNQDGSLDNSFHFDGKVTRDIALADDEINAIAIQADGKIVVAGYTDNGVDYDFLIARFNTDGSSDNSFGSGGIVVTPIGSGDEFVNALVIQPDGRIVACGHTASATNYNFAIVRYTNGGLLDNSFGTGGKVTTSIGAYSDVARSLMLQSDGKLIAAGFSTDGSFMGDFALARYTSNGTLDASFSGDGIETFTIGSGDDLGYASALQSDGRILIAGHSWNGSNYDFAIARVTTNGTLDNTFSTDGKQTT